MLLADLAKFAPEPAVRAASRFVDAAWPDGTSPIHRIRDVDGPALLFSRTDSWHISWKS